MSKSPGHQRWPDHQVRESPVDHRMAVEIDGQRIAESADVIRVDEDGNPPRYYFPRTEVRMEKLERTATSSQCPFKGTAHYFSLRADGRVLNDAVWSYEDPYDEHRTLKECLAFYDEKYRDIHVVPMSSPNYG